MKEKAKFSLEVQEVSMSMQNQVCLVTGANSGVGKATALGLAELGATVVMLCRNEARGKAAQEEIIARSGNDQVDLMLTDLSEQASIRAFATAFKNKYEHLHVLSHNAGIVLMERHVTSDGLEKLFAVNYLSRFLLTHLLLDVLQSSHPARVTNVSGPALALRVARINFEDIQFEKRFNWMQANIQSLLLGVVFTSELARRLAGTGVTANAFFPGIVKSKVTHNLPWYVGFFPNIILSLFKDECKTSVYLASSPQVERVTGKFFTNRRVVDVNSKYLNGTAGARLWQISTALTGAEK